MANVYIEQYRNGFRDEAGAVVQIEGALIENGSAVLDASGEGGTIALNAAAKYIYIRSAGDCYGGFTNDPDDLDDDAGLENDRFDLQVDIPRWKPVQGTHFSVILKADV